MTDTLMPPVADEIARALAALDLDALRTRYWQQDEFLAVERLFPPALITELVTEVDRVRPAVHRNYIPKHKNGSVDEPGQALRVEHEGRDRLLRLPRSVPRRRPRLVSCVGSSSRAAGAGRWLLSPEHAIHCAGAPLIGATTSCARFSQPAEATVLGRATIARPPAAHK